MSRPTRKNTPCRKAADEFAFLLEVTGVSRAVNRTRADDRVEDRHNVLGVLNPHIANVHHAGDKRSEDQNIKRS